MPKPYPQPSKDAWAGDIATLCFSGPGLPDLPHDDDRCSAMPSVQLDVLCDQIFRHSDNRQVPRNEPGA